MEGGSIMAFMKNVIVVCMLLIGCCAYAQESTASRKILVDASDLPPEVLARIETKEKIETYGEYVGLGKEIGTAMNEGLEALTKHTAEFAETKVGRFTMFIIAYKVIGTDLIQFVVGVPLLIAFSVIFIWSWRRNCITRPILKREHPDKTKDFELFEGTEGEKLSYVVVYLISVLLAIAVIFV